jgi:Fuc2NAc and GlcNAc transferase
VNERSSHTTPTPHGGGIAIAVTWFIGLSFFYMQGEVDASLYKALMVGVVLSVVSYMDDLYELSAKLRLVVQSVVAIGGLFFLGGLEHIDFFFFTLSNEWVCNLFAFFIILWFINLYNFLDGIDGYAGSEALFLAFGGYLLFGGVHFIVLFMAVAGFLVWNWHKAKIFMGDVGSTLLGYSVAVFTIYYTNEDASNLWVWLVLFGVFFFDATITLLRRYNNGEILTQAHKKHAYQRLTQAGFTHEKVVLLSLLINFFILLLVFYMKNKFLLLLSSGIIFFLVMRYIDKQKAFA